MQPGRDEPGEVRHVAEEECVHLVGDLAELPRLDGSRVRAAAADDQLRPVLLREPQHLVVIDDVRLARDAVVRDRVEPPGEVDLEPVREVTAVRELEREDRVARLQRRHVDGHVRLRSGVRLDVRVLGAEQLLRAVDRRLLDLVDDLAAAVVALARVALGVLVRRDGADRLEHRRPREVLGRDQLDLPALALELLAEQRCDLRVDGGETGGCEVLERLVRDGHDGLLPGRIQVDGTRGVGDRAGAFPRETSGALLTREPWAPPPASPSSSASSGRPPLLCRPTQGDSRTPARRPGGARDLRRRPELRASRLRRAERPVLRIGGALLRHGPAAAGVGSEPRVERARDRRRRHGRDVRRRPLDAGASRAQRRRKQRGRSRRLHDQPRNARRRRRSGDDQQRHRHRRRGVGHARAPRQGARLPRRSAPTSRSPTGSCGPSTTAPRSSTSRSAAPAKARRSATQLRTPSPTASSSLLPPAIRQRTAPTIRRRVPARSQSPRRTRTATSRTSRPSGRG